MRHSHTVGFIGGGNMASSLIGGLVAKGQSPNHVWVIDKEKDKLSALHQAYAVNTTENLAELVQQVEVLVIAVKPQHFAATMQECACHMDKTAPLVMSVAAGITTAAIAALCPSHTPIIRVMPNTPALIQKGMSVLCAGGAVSESHRFLAESIMKSVGEIAWVDDEKHMDTVTALSGSGPAYYFLMMEALSEGAVALGLPEVLSKQLTLQTALGAVELAKASESSLAELRKQVTSPGGTTEAALNVLLEQDIKQTFFAALQAAKQRSEDLS